MAVDRPVTIGSGQATLFATVTRPETVPSPRRPGVLLIAGSGPTDRDGNSNLPGVQPATLKLIAQALESEGYVSLRFDKRGIAASRAAGADEATLRLDTYVDDAVAWTKALAAEPGVSCVVILGHSEGALIGALASAKAPVCGLISVAGAGRPFDAVVDAQIRAQGASEDVLKQVDAIWTELKAGRTVPQMPATHPLFRPSVQPYLSSVLAHPPTDAIAAVSAPILVMQGQTDLQVTEEDARRLVAAAGPTATLALLPGVNHVLKTAPADRTANVATYADPARPLDPAVLPAILTFLKHVPLR
jgi:pimeloyl-ACP methyl ester carboxylesterase